MNGSIQRAANSAAHNSSLPKQERISSRTLIRQLFTGTNRSFSIFPIRIVIANINDNSKPTLSVLFSVSTRRFKHAVDRNRVKRQMREAYRKNKHILVDPLRMQSKQAAVAFLWLDKDHRNSDEINDKIIRLLQLTAERL